MREAGVGWRNLVVGSGVWPAGLKGRIVKDVRSGPHPDLECVEVRPLPSNGRGCRRSGDCGFFSGEDDFVFGGEVIGVALEAAAVEFVEELARIG